MLVDAYDTRTGKKLPYRVRKEAVGHPAIAPHLSLTPPAYTPSEPPADTAAPGGDGDKSADLAESTPPRSGAKAKTPVSGEKE